MRLAAAALLLSSTAMAAGLGRPSSVGARAIGLGGGYTAVADDPTAVWHNPAGTAIYGDNVVYLGGELIFLDRSYTPDANSPLGQAGVRGALHEATPPTFIPVAGVTTRFGFGKTAPTRIAFSLTAYNAYGGLVRFDKSQIHDRGIASTQLSDFEITPTLAYQINEVFQLGAGIRIGVNTFSVEDSEATFRANLAGSSAGAGAVFGVMARPHRLVQLGAVYRTSLSTTINGSGDVTVAQGQPRQQDFSLHVDWPQSAALGATLFAHRRLFVTAQADWTGWSSLQKLTINLGGVPQLRQLRYRDTYTVHAGAQLTATRALVFRVGAAIDSDAIPDRTVRRENRDEMKASLACGIGVHVWRLFFDAAFEVVLPFSERVIAAPAPNADAPENETGRYAGKVFSGELAAQLRF